MPVVNIAASASGTSSGGAILSMWIRFSIYHYWAALHFSDLVGQIEEAHQGDSYFDIKHRTYVISSICASAFFIESFINEFLKEICEGVLKEGPCLSKKAIDEVKARWNEIERRSAMKKLQFALSILGQQKFNEESALFIDCGIVFELRNIFAHYKPQSVNPQNEFDIAEKLKSKFKSNKLMNGSRNAFFPDHCLGFGCTNWAATSAINLIDEFCNRTEIPKTYKLLKWQ